MTLIAPLNDGDCQTLVHAKVTEYAAQPEVRAYAREFRDTDDLADRISGRDQRDDRGDPRDGPKLACDVPQRARFAPSDPNCVERTLEYLTIAEILDPDTERTSASMVVNGAWHTFPVEIRDGLPVVIVLDPYGPPRNAAVATAYDLRNVAVNRADVVVPWFLEIARNACLDAYAGDCFDRAVGSLRNAVLSGAPLAGTDVDDLDWVLASAEADAALWGERGADSMGRVEQSIRNLAVKLDGGQVGGFLRKLVGTGERIGRQLGPKAVRAALIAEFGPAAAIALQGLDVAVQESDPTAEAAETSTALTARPAAGQAATSVTEGGGTTGRAAKGAKAAKAEKPKRSNLENLRRITFGFRTRDNNQR